MQHIPTIQYELISSCNYPIYKDSPCYCYFIWCILKGHVNTTKLSLQCAIQILLHIITKWNGCKGWIKEITFFLDGMNFLFSKGSPKQMLVICELKKSNCRWICYETLFPNKTNSYRERILCHPIIPLTQHSEVMGLPLQPHNQLPTIQCNS